MIPREPIARPLTRTALASRLPCITRVWMRTTRLRCRAVHLLGPPRDPRFVQMFARKGRFRTLMERVPVHVITTRAALRGATAYGLDTLNPQLGAMTS